MNQLKPKFAAITSAEANMYAGNVELKQGKRRATRKCNRPVCLLVERYIMANIAAGEDGSIIDGIVTELEKN